MKNTKNKIDRSTSIFFFIFLNILFSCSTYGIGNKANKDNDDYIKIKLDSISITDSMLEETNYYKNQLDSLSREFPNPFSPKTEVRFQLSNMSRICIEVYDPSGQLLGIVFNSNLNKGKYIACFKDSNLKSGVYIIRILENNKRMCVSKILINK